MTEEAIGRFDCFGGRCSVLITSTTGGADARAAVAAAQARMLSWHRRFSRFLPGSELSRLNADRRMTVEVSATMIRLAQAALDAARLTDGLVDPTLVDQLRAGGYGRSLTEIGAPPPLALAQALADAPRRGPAHPDPSARWQEIVINPRARTITRPPGVALDSGGVGKGLFGDLLAERLHDQAYFAVDAAGDIRLGGHGPAPRPVQIAPIRAQAGPGGDPEPLHVFELRRGAVATSSIARRAWRDADGRPAHHLLDPCTGRPAFTGLVQVSALAPTGVEAEARAKAALLSGPARAADWLPDGGVIVADDGGVCVIAPSPALTGTRPRIVLDLAGGAAAA